MDDGDRRGSAYLDCKTGSLGVVLCENPQLEAGVGLQIFDLLPDAGLLLGAAGAAIKEGGGGGGSSL